MIQSRGSSGIGTREVPKQWSLGYICTKGVGEMQLMLKGWEPKPYLFAIKMKYLSYDFVLQPRKNRS
jgi:hypothetical protein